MTKVSTIGIRNQVTLPKDIREEIGRSTKFQAHIRAVDDSLEITPFVPEGTYSKIKISEKGQFVVPKSYRDSFGYREGTNLIFTVTDKEKWIIQIKKLAESKPVLSTANYDMVVEVLKISRNQLQHKEGKLYMLDKPSGMQVISLQDALKCPHLIIEKASGKEKGYFLIPLID